MSIEKLKSSIKSHGGVLHSNRFNIIFTPPKMSLLNLNPSNLLGSLISGSFSVKSLINDPRDINLLCKSASIPSRQLATLDFQNHTNTMKMVNNHTDEEITTVFRLTSDMYIKTMFDSWQQAIFDVDNYYVGYKKDFSTDVTIQQLNKEDKPVYGIRLINAFPTSIGGYALDNDQQGDAAEIAIQWSYDRWVAEDALSSTLGGGLRAIGNLLS